MSLKLCKHGCGNQVAPDAAACPKCGGANPHPQGFFMASLNIIAVVITLIVVIVYFW